MRKQMTFNEYQIAAARTDSPKTGDQLLLNAALGLAGEAGEFADLVKKHLFQGHQLDTMHLAEELGDLLWYIAQGCRGLGLDLQDIAEWNNSKLQLRYPNGFEAERSVKRDEDA